MRLFRRAAVLALAALPFATRATAAESDTLTIVGTFRAAGQYDGPLGPELAGVLADGAAHTWTLTMYGVTSQHGSSHDTIVTATSFDLAFAGPDAATLDAVVGTQGGAATIYMSNIPVDATYWWMSLEGAGLTIESVQARVSSDADGYPIASPQTLVAEETDVSDGIGTIYSWSDTVNVSGEIAPPLPPPPPTIGIADASALEGSRGKSQLRLSVAMSSVSAQTVTVNYRTVDGTALATSDYASASGSLTFLPGERFKTITVSVKSDRVREADETFTVVLSGAVGTSIADGVAVATIRNDD